MPEGHSLRRLALAFEELFVGEVCSLSSPQGRFTVGAALLTGERMVSSQSYGKHLFLGFRSASEPAQPETDEASRWIHIHLGMYGAWRFQGTEMPTTRIIGAPRLTGKDEGGEEIWFSEEEWVVPEPRGAVRLRILLPNRVADLTGPSQCKVVDEDERNAILGRLGPDPLTVSTPVTSESAALKHRFVEAVRKSSRPVGDLVLDQSVIAGVGNIYRAEGLFRIGISPFREGQRVSVRRLGALWDDFVTLLNKGVAEGTIVTVEAEPDSDGVRDPQVSRWYVYHRAGEPCLRCGTTVRVKPMKGRKVYWCPGCQR